MWGLFLCDTISLRNHGYDEINIDMLARKGNGSLLPILSNSFIFKLYYDVRKSLDIKQSSND